MPMLTVNVHDLKSLTHPADGTRKALLRAKKLPTPRRLLCSALFVFTLAAMCLSASAALANLPVREGQGPIMMTELDGGITTVASEFVQEAINAAKEQGAQALVIRLDTPGGLLEATRTIVREFLSDSIPIIVWVGPAGARAGSAGVFITMASHVAIMAPAANIGAAHPVSATGEDVKGDMRTKLENDTAAWARSIAEVRERNVEWAEKSVRDSVSITAQEALKENVIDFLAASEAEVLAALHGHQVRMHSDTVSLNTTNAQLVHYEMSPRQKLVQFLANPNLAYILVLIGLFGLFLEFKSPGLMVPGVIGAICLGIVLGVQVMPINWIGMLMIVGGAICLIADIYVTSFGILAASGIALLMMGSFMLFDVPESDFRVQSELVWGAGLGFSILVLVIGAALLKAMRDPPATGQSALIGGYGEVFMPITPDSEGQISYRGSYWTAIAEESIDKGNRVRVIDMLGTKAVVEAAPDDTKGES